MCIDYDKPQCPLITLSPGVAVLLGWQQDLILSHELFLRPLIPLSLMDRSQTSTETLAHSTLICDKPIWLMKWEYLHCHQQQQRIPLSRGTPVPALGFLPWGPGPNLPSQELVPEKAGAGEGLSQEFARSQCFTHEGLEVKKRLASQKATWPSAEPGIELAAAHFRLECFLP